MARLGYVEAFARYRAVLDNQRWAFSAVAEDGSIVISCWAQFLRPVNRTIMRFTDTLSRRQNKKLGLSVLVQHLELARTEQRKFRLVIAYTAEPEVVAQGKGAGSIQKDFDVRPDLVGELVEFDGDRYVIDFRKEA